MGSLERAKKLHEHLGKRLNQLESRARHRQVIGPAQPLASLVAPAFSLGKTGEVGEPLSRRPAKPIIRPHFEPVAYVDPQDAPAGLIRKGALDRDHDRLGRRTRLQLDMPSDWSPAHHEIVAV